LLSSAVELELAAGVDEDSAGLLLDSLLDESADDLSSALELSSEESSLDDSSELEDLYELDAPQVL
jgi:hypothetical protein